MEDDTLTPTEGLEEEGVGEAEADSTEEDADAPAFDTMDTEDNE